MIKAPGSHSDRHAPITEPLQPDPTRGLNIYRVACYFLKPRVACGRGGDVTQAIAEHSLARIRR